MARTSEKTRERIVKAAEVLFAREGYEAVSLRKITTVAKANIAAVNYHFGTKEELLEKVMERQLLPIMEKRIEQLREVAAQETASMEEVMRSFTQPIMEQAAVSGMESLLFGKLYGRLVDEHADEIPTAVKVLQRMFHEQWFVEIEKRSGGLTSSEIAWRMHAYFGAVYHCLTVGERVVLPAGAEKEVVDLARKLGYMVAIGSGMFTTAEGAPRAAVATQTKGIKKVAPKKSAKKPAKKVVKKVAKKAAKKAATKRAAARKPEGGQSEFGF